jgi:hypothetical protein
MVRQQEVETPETYEDAVRLLAEAHGDGHGPGTEIYRCDGADKQADGGAGGTVRLLEVNRRFPSARREELRATEFGRARDFPYKSAIVLASPSDLERLRDGTLRLPDGWHFDAAKRVWPA